jgi:hypothetical protein
MEASVPRMLPTARTACGDASETDGSDFRFAAIDQELAGIGRIQMKRFHPSTPRAAAAIAALAMTLITFGLAIVVPATFDADGIGDRAQASNAVSPTADARVLVVANVDIRRLG